MANVKYTANFLHRFSEPEGFKFLTHDFDSEGGDYLEYAGRCRAELTEAQGRIPDTLYDLLFGFFYGPEWQDSLGKVHNVHCGGGELFDWCEANPGVHPINSSEYGSELVALKNSIRVYQMDMPSYMKKICRRTKNLKFEFDNLEDMDCYTDVRQLLLVAEKIIATMAASRFADSYGEVVVSARRGAYKNFSVAELCIEQVGSFPDKTAREILERISSGGGDLASMKEMMSGYFDWSIESRFAGHPLRMNIITSSDAPEIEDIEEAVATGFRHVIKVYYKL